MTERGTGSSAPGAVPTLRVLAQCLAHLVLDGTADAQHARSVAEQTLEAARKVKAMK